MEIRIIDNHPSLKNNDERFQKLLQSLLDSFKIEGIHFSEEEVAAMIGQVEAEIKK